MYSYTYNVFNNVAILGYVRQDWLASGRGGRKGRTSLVKEDLSHEIGFGSNVVSILKGLQQPLIRFQSIRFIQKVGVPSFKVILKS